MKLWIEIYETRKRIPYRCTQVGQRNKKQNVGSFQMLSLCIYWLWSYKFYFSSINIMYYVDWFEYATPCLYPQNKSYFIIVFDIFDVFSYYIFKYFVDGLRVCVHQWYWPVILTCVHICLCFCICDISACYCY